jgi:hypothetical protein
VDYRDALSGEPMASALHRAACLDDRAAHRDARSYHAQFLEDAWAATCVASSTMMLFTRIDGDWRA